MDVSILSAASSTESRLQPTVEPAFLTSLLGLCLSPSVLLPPEHTVAENTVEATTVSERVRRRAPPAPKDLSPLSSMMVPWSLPVGSVSNVCLKADQ